MTWILNFWILKISVYLKSFDFTIDSTVQFFLFNYYMWNMSQVDWVQLPWCGKQLCEEQNSAQTEKTAFYITPFVENIESTGEVSLNCFNKTYETNKTQVRNHFKGCQSFWQKYRIDFRLLTGLSTSDMFTHSTSKRAQQSIYVHYISFTKECHRKLDFAFADAILKDGSSFSSFQSDNWKPFWKHFFGKAYQILNRYQITEKCLFQSFNYVIIEWFLFFHQEELSVYL